MATVTLVAGTRAAITVTGLGTLASTAGVLSNAITGAGYLYANFDLYMNWGSAPAADLPVELWFVQQADGTNYEDATGATPAVIMPQWLAYTFLTRAATTTYRVSAIVPIPPGSFKVYVVNKSGAAFTAGAGGTATALSWTPMTEQVA